ncbi:MAG: hypothetical protein DMF56_21770 [Acidobacteria bacterium]|nr:MAG: hypothetical protein DMF56_21770 [Acidobacteriota bacterium]
MVMARMEMAHMHERALELCHAAEKFACDPANAHLIRGGRKAQCVRAVGEGISGRGEGGRRNRSRVAG